MSCYSPGKGLHGEGQAMRRAGQYFRTTALLAPLLARLPGNTAGTIARRGRWPARNAGPVPHSVHLPGG